MKKSFLIAVLTLTFVGCTRKAKNPPPAPTEITSDTVVQVQSHNARNSLEYIGLYKGKLPCADCAGIEVSLQLSEEFTYILTTKYLGRQTKVQEQKGTYSWDKAGKSIRLDNIKDNPNQYFVGENSLTQLDLNGNKITGKLADNYILRKLPEAQAAKTDAAAGDLKPLLLADTMWKLSELNGKPIQSPDPSKPYSLTFRGAEAFAAFAGCNSIAGKFDSHANSVRFYNIISTRMACDKMDIESQLLKILEAADRFVGNEKVLQLRKGEKLLAKFEVYQMPE